MPATSLSREFPRLPRLVLLREAVGLTDDRGEGDNRSFEPLGLSGTTLCFSRLGLPDRRSELGEDLPPSVASGDATEDFRGNVLLSAGAAVRGWDLITGFVSRMLSVDLLLVAPVLETRGGGLLAEDDLFSASWRLGDVRDSTVSCFGSRNFTLSVSFAPDNVGDLRSRSFTLSASLATDKDGDSFRFLSGMEAELLFSLLAWFAFFIGITARLRLLLRSTLP